MKITIKCTCGNSIEIPAPNKKLTMLRDYLDSRHFYLGRLTAKKFRFAAISVNRR